MHLTRSAREHPTCLLRLQADIWFIWRSDSDLRIFEFMHCSFVLHIRSVPLERKRNATETFWDHWILLLSSTCYLISGTVQLVRLHRNVGEWDARSSLFTTFVSVHAGQDGLSCGEEARRWESIFRDNHCGSGINVTVYGREDILQVETPPAIVVLKIAPAVEWPLLEFVYRVAVTWTLWFCPLFVGFSFGILISLTRFWWTSDYKIVFHVCSWISITVSYRKSCGFALWHFLRLNGGVTQNK